MKDIVRLEDCLVVLVDDNQVNEVEYDRLAAELAQLRADAERWRKVVEVLNRKFPEEAGPAERLCETFSAIAHIVKDSSHA